MAVAVGILVILGLVALFLVIIPFKKRHKVPHKAVVNPEELKRYMDVAHLKEEEERRLKEEEERRLKEKNEEENRRVREKLREEKHKTDREKREQERKDFIEKYKKLTPEEILLDEKLSYLLKLRILREAHDYSESDADDLIKMADRLRKKARLKFLKTKVAQDIQELYGNTGADDAGKPIPEDVQSAVWQRDGGKCVKCGSNENLEFSHIIPLAKGGSNTERNIQLLCEKCNRQKRDTMLGR